MSGILVQLNVSGGGIPKLPVERALVSVEGVEGDWQKNRKYHGGPDRAVCLFSVELYDWLRGQGIDLVNGAVGETFTTRGVDLQTLGPGDRLFVGRGGAEGEGCAVEITKVRVPCATLRRWHPRLHKIIEGHSGWMAKVVTEGVVRAGDEVKVQARASL